tara:strand:- start:5811 stop:7124 length:1314 start_codon:yes stop_codon:yes gene_type:complete
MSSLTSVDIKSIGLSNEIIWTIGDGILSFVEIKKYLAGENNSFNNNPVTITPDEYSLSNLSFKDYDISQNTSYRYELFFGNLNPANMSAYCNAFNGLVDSGSVNYDYINSEFTLNWIDTSIKQNLDPHTNYTYDIFIKAQPKPSLWSSNILHFKNQNTNTSFSIKNNTTHDINGQAINIAINTKYTFFVSPSYVFGTNGFPALALDGKISYYPDNTNTQIICNYSKNRLPPALGSVNLFKEPPSNFSIKTPYNNNKISFSWDNINDTNFNNYNITLNIDGETVSGFPITTNNNSYILDNSNFTYIPGLYTIQISANYYGLETEKNFLNFTIPVTAISLNLKPLNDLGQVTNDYKNVSSIKLNWTKFNYNNIYYKIKVKIVNKEGISQPDLCFYTTITNYTFPIDADIQVELKFSVSYEFGNVNQYNNHNWIYGGTPY